MINSNLYNVINSRVNISLTPISPIKENLSRRKIKAHLTESQLHNVIRMSVKKILKESKYKFIWDEECDKNGVIAAKIIVLEKDRDLGNAIFECTLYYEDEDFYYATAICVESDVYSIRI